MNKDNTPNKEFELSNNIKEMFGGLLEIYKLEYRQLKPQVAYIINNRVVDMNQIEYIFERLLNVPYEPCYQLFLKLCAYVSTFNKQIAFEYIEIYNDLYGEEEPKTKKKELF